MKGSIKLGRFANIDVYLHVTFLLFLAFIGVSQVMAGRSLASAVDGVLFFCGIFGCVLLHEFGHALAARHYGIRTRDITLLPIGGVARLDRMPQGPLQEFWVALAGPAVNVGIVALVSVWIVLTGHAMMLDHVGVVRGSFATRLVLANTMLVLFNMIPAFPMDGGRVLRSLLSLRLGNARATQLAASLGQVIAVIFAILGIAAILMGVGNPLLLFIALFIWIGASQEAALAQFRPPDSMRIPPVLRS